MDDSTWADADLQSLAGAVAAEFGTRGWLLATAESCTGGWIAKICTDLAGSSAWFERGFVTYSNAAKQDLLAVPARLLEQYGAVSAEVACAMAEGALRHGRADHAVAVTGIAGPDGGTPLKPVGTVCFGWSSHDRATITDIRRFAGTREDVRRQTVAHALLGLLEPLR